MTTLSSEVTQTIIGKMGKSPKDSGNTRVQIALFTHRIRELTEHIKSNRKDFHSRLGLTKMVARRRRLLKYLERIDLEGYRKILNELNLRH